MWYFVWCLLFIQEVKVVSFKITENFARTVKPIGKTKTYSDDGLLLVVTDQGKKTFYHKYRQDGKQHKPKIGDYPVISVKEARQLVLKAKSDMQLRGIKQVGINMTFKEFVEGEYKEILFANNRTAKKSYQTLQKHFIPLLGGLRIKDIQPRPIERWIAKRSTEVKASTIKRELNDLRTVFKQVQDWYNFPTIMPRIKNPRIINEKEQFLLTDDEYKRLEATCDEYSFLYYFGDQGDVPIEWDITSTKKIPIMLVYIIKVAANTGMRKGEILKLKFSDIAIDTKMITVRGMNEKTSRYREIPISNKLFDEIQNWGFLRYGGDFKMNDDDLVFPIKDIQTSWTTFRKRAGLEHIEFKTLRHHFASTLVLKGTALSTVMKLMGHTNIETTQRYLSVRTEDKFEAVNLL
jgi:integrase